MMEIPDMTEEITKRIKTAIPDAIIKVSSASEKHYELSVVSASFTDQPTVKRQQRVYAAISDLMAGDAAPVHAIDRMETLTP